MGGWLDTGEEGLGYQQEALPIALRGREEVTLHSRVSGSASHMAAKQVVF